MSTTDPSNPNFDANGNFIGTSLDAPSVSSDPSTDPSQGIQNLLKILAGVGGAVGGNLLARNSASNAVPPQLSQLLDMSVQRAQYQNPLFQAMTSGAYQMLPDFAKTGAGGGAMTGPTPPSSGSSGLSTAADGMTAAALLGLLLKTPGLLSTLMTHAATTPDKATPPASPSGDGLTGGVGGGGGGLNNDLSSPLAYLKGNPNASLINPILGGAFSGNGTQFGDASMTGGSGRAQLK